MVLSDRNLAAIAIFPLSPFARDFKSASFHRRAFNSSAMISSANASEVPDRSSP